jgi:hypothetical protein
MWSELGSEPYAYLAATFCRGTKDQPIKETQNYTVYGLCPSFRTANTRKHFISEIIYISVLR